MVNLEFYNAFWFLQDHPALKGKYNQGVDLIDVTVMKCCKHGLSFSSGEDEDITVYESDDRYAELVAKGYEVEDICGGFKTITVPYSKCYGEPWKLAKVNFWLELGFSRYYKHEGNYESASTHDCRMDIGSATYEEGIIKLAGLVKELYGDWSCTPGNSNCIIPSWVTENNELEPYFAEAADGENSESNLFGFSRNKKHIGLYSVELNELWWLQCDEEYMEGEPISIGHLINKDLNVCRNDDRFGKNTIDIL